MSEDRLEIDAAEEARQAERARKLFAGACDFVAGAAKVEMIPPDSLPEFAFVGRSNVGKSSLINALTGRNALARVSQTPGRTRQINFFNLGGVMMLVDLPGYGYAKISKTMAAEWQHLISTYLRGRASLRRVVLLIDARRGIKDVDHEVMKMLDSAAVSYVVTLTKIDTLKPAEREKVIAQVTAQIAGNVAVYPEILVTSAESGEGMKEIRQQLTALVTS
jgi:GTP-binding protein